MNNNYLSLYSKVKGFSVGGMTGQEVLQWCQRSKVKNFSIVCDQDADDRFFLNLYSFLDRLWKNHRLVGFLSDYLSTLPRPFSIIKIEDEVHLFMDEDETEEIYIDLGARNQGKKVLSIPKCISDYLDFSDFQKLARIANHHGLISDGATSIIDYF